jgi:hypothetical protein
MEKAKITGLPNKNSLEAVKKWQEDKFGKSNIEINELPEGKYMISVKFKTYRKTTNNFEDYFHVLCKKGNTEKDLIKLANGEITSYGLHNFALDSNIPVKVKLEHASGKIIEYEQKINSSGYPVYDK